MANPWAGEVSVTLNGEAHVAKLTLGALAELEAELGTGTLVELVERFEAGRFSTRDVLMLIVAGLRGGGWTGRAVDLIVGRDRRRAGGCRAGRRHSFWRGRSRCPRRMSGFDWPGLMRAGIGALGLRPDQFWRLTPAELVHDAGRSGRGRTIGPGAVDGTGAGLAGRDQGGRKWQ